MKLGIVGLPNVGKSTLFNAITQAGAEAANYPFCTIEPNVGVVTVPDERLRVLTELYDAERTIYTTIEFYDIAGLVKGASKGEGLGNKFLGHIREVAAVVHVVRCFDDDGVVHVDGSTDPARDIETINMELIFSDLEVIDRRVQRTQKNLKGDKGLAKELALLERVKQSLLSGVPARAAAWDEEERVFINSLELLTAKPVIYAANISEAEVSAAEENGYVKSVREIAKSEGSDVVVLAAKVEAELAELDDEDRAVFLEELGIGESGLDQLVKASYHLLDLISFLTAGKPEVRAWTIRRGTKAPQAAGKIHTDFEKGFIRAETVDYENLIACGSLSAAREKGLVRSEGKEYVVRDGDVVHFLFNV
ncbi:MAG: redox-regulated ATPase YchF [Clostridiales Family XIII bacterium]|jgi:GTP-binding protein YchF|nr:redox-regulated ATPase YchF [Clostridiales Family XIII bacterium]